MHERLSLLDPEVLLQLVGPLLSRVIDDAAATPQTIQATVRASIVPEALVSPAVRRALRPRGPLSRRSGISAHDLLKEVNTGTDIVPARRPPEGMLTVRANDVSSERLTGVAADWLKRGPTATRSQRKDVLVALQGLLASLLPAAPKPRPPALRMQSIASTLTEATDPSVTIPRRVGHRVQDPPGWAPADPLTPILASPRIDTPLARHLIATAPTWLLPGIADLPDDSVTALSTNRRFVEALLVGANHEFGRELLWRGYPTDQRGTVFHRFWDKAGSAAGSTDDIDDIDAWTGGLGSHVAATSDEFVLLVRGQLLRRYPNTIVYASRAEWDTSVTPPVRRLASTPKEVFPSFGGTISPDITYAGFDLPTPALGAAPSTNDAGWFFVFLQPPTQTRFGLDTAPDPAPSIVAAGWDGLDWGRVETTDAGYFRLGANAPQGIPAAEWTGLTSAALAMRCRQKRFRAAIHATDLVLP